MAKEDEINVSIKYEDDRKGKWQSVSARVEVDGDDYYFPGIAGFGETEKEAKEELKDKIIPLLAKVNKLFMTMDESEQLEKDLILKTELRIIEIKNKLDTFTKSLKDLQKEVNQINDCKDILKVLSDFCNKNQQVENINEILKLFKDFCDIFISDLRLICNSRIEELCLLQVGEIRDIILSDDKEDEI